MERSEGLTAALPAAVNYPTTDEHKLTQIRITDVIVIYLLLPQ